MAIAVKFGIFTKRPNSTKVATDDDFTVEYQGVLKESADLLSPEIRVLMPNNSQSPVLFNYAFIPSFIRYYFVTNWRYEGRCWYAEMVCDELATWKTSIGNSTQFVLRSASQYDGSVFDVSKVPTGSPATSVINVDNPFKYSFTDADGCFIIGVNTGNFDSTTFGVTTFYALNRENMRILAGKLLDDTGYLNVTEISSDLQKILYNPIQYFSSFFWLPVPYSAVDGTVKTSLKYGWWTFDGVSCKLCGLQRKQFEFTLELPAHPMATTIGEYLNGEPYTKYTLSFPPFCSDLQLPSNILQRDFLNNNRSIRIRVYVDFNDGSALMEVFKNVQNNYTIATIRAGLAVPLSLMQTARDTTQNIVDVASIGQGIANFADSTIGGAIRGSSMGLLGAAGGAIGGILSSASGVLSSVDSAIKNSAPKITQLSQNGGSVGYLGFPIKLQAEFYMPTGDANEIAGRPLFKMTQISELRGYTICSNAQISAPCTAAENKIITDFLNGGFYYE